MEHPSSIRGDELTNALIAQLNELVYAMHEDQDGGIKVPRVVQFAAAAVPGADHAAISMASDGHQPKTIAATGELPVLVDKIQYDLDEGPCMQALIQSDLVWANDLTTDQQWPQFAPRAVEATGVQSMASYRLYLTQDRRAALNLYATTPHVFDRLALGVGAIFASYASLTLLNDLHQDRIMHLERALESSREIGTAVGILMARELCTADQAFDMLRIASQHTHRKLRDIAAAVKETGTLPHNPPRAVR
jgi:ANTAR domain/GAF domain